MGATDPAGHATHAEVQLVQPLAAKYPAAHIGHVGEPAAVAAQAAQEVAPAEEECVLGAHGAHAAADEAPVAARYVPAGQAVQRVEPAAAAKKPAWHASHEPPVPPKLL